MNSSRTHTKIRTNGTQEPQAFLPEFRGPTPLIIIALSGLDLVVVQYFLVREASAQLFINE